MIYLYHIFISVKLNEDLHTMYIETYLSDKNYIHFYSDLKQVEIKNVEVKTLSKNESDILAKHVSKKKLININSYEINGYNDD